MIKSRSFTATFFDAWVLKLEKKAFGWHYYSMTTETERYLDDDLKVRTRVTVWYEFRRKSPYSHNFFFNLTEIINKIISFFRRIYAWIFSIGFVFAILGVIALIFLGGVEYIKLLLSAVGIAFAVYVGGVALSLLTALSGFIWRKIFRIDEKLQSHLAAQGYSTDLSDCSMRGEYY